MHKNFARVSPFLLIIASAGCGVADRLVDVDRGEDGAAGSGDAASDVSHAGTGGGAGNAGSAASGTSGAGGSADSGGSSAGGAAGNGSSGAAGSAVAGAAGNDGPADGASMVDVSVARDAAARDAAAPDAPASAAPDAAPDGCTPNACGGCGVLAGEPNGVCGAGGCGKYVCSADKNAVTCSDPSAGGCCIGAVVYTSGTVKSDNTCMGCAPATSPTAWSPRATCGNGNAGCSCVSGSPKETNCSDGLSNDGDSTADCSDTDCNGVVCLTLASDARAPNMDYWVRYDEQGMSFQENGTPTLELYTGSSSGPHAFQHSFVWLIFGALPQSSAATFSKAVLRFYYTSTSSDQGNTTTPTTISIKDARAIGSGDPIVCNMSLPVVSATPSAVTCDVTATVNDWFANGVPVGQRGFRISSDTFGDQSVIIPATEGTAATAPRLLLDYTTRCAANTCPNL